MLALYDVSKMKGLDFARFIRLKQLIARQKLTTSLSLALLPHPKVPIISIATESTITVRPTTVGV